MTTSPPWLQIPKTRPIDGSTYWVCQYRWFSTPFLATYVDKDEEWQPVDLIKPLPWYVTPWYRAR